MPRALPTTSIGAEFCVDSYCNSAVLATVVLGLGNCLVLT